MGGGVEHIPWVVTREAPEGELLVAAMRERGISAVAVPAIARTPLPWPASLVPASAEDIWFLTSAYAVRCAFASGHLTADASIAALSPATARAAHDGGASVGLTASGGAVALANALVMRDGDAMAARAAPRRLIYPTSDVGLTQPEQGAAVALLEQHFNVMRAAVYTTRASPQFAATLSMRIGRTLRAVISSPSAAHAVMDAVGTGGLSVHTLVAVGASTAAALPNTAHRVPPGMDVVDFLASFELAGDRTPQDNA